jgi:hypothetical protein
VEWVKSEREEVQKAAAEAASKLKEAEATAARAKNLRRDELKKANKEKNSAQSKAEVGLCQMTSKSFQRMIVGHCWRWHSSQRRSRLTPVKLIV